MTCDCCGGELPDYEIWLTTREYDNDDECTGSIDPTTGRCRAFVDDKLWSIDKEEKD